LPVPFLLQFLDRDKLERGGVDTITETGRPRTVGENMPQMGIPFLGSNFYARYSMGRVFVCRDIFRFQRPVKTGPAGPRIKFVGRAEQRLTRNHVDVNSRLLMIPILVLKRRFRSAFLRDFELKRRQSLHRFRLWVVRHGVSQELRARDQPIADATKVFRLIIVHADLAPLPFLENVHARS